MVGRWGGGAVHRGDGCGENSLGELVCGGVWEGWLLP